MGHRIFLVMVGLLIILSGAEAQVPQHRQTDTLHTYSANSLVSERPGIFNFGLFGQLGTRQCDCPSSGFNMLNIGALLMLDVVAVDSMYKALFLRGSIAGGTLSNADIGIGYFMSKRFYISIAYALLDRPSYSSYRNLNRLFGFGYHAASFALFSLGVGRQGVLFEADFYIPLERDQYSSQYTFPEVQEKQYFDSWPIGITLRIGYTF